MEQKFYICAHCGNIVAFVKNSGVPVMCCGQKMQEIVPGTTDASVEKHVPVYTVEGNKVEVEKCDYYIVGTLLDGEGNAVNYAVKEGVSPALVAGEDGTYSVDFVAYDATGCNDYSWMTQQGKTDANGVAAIISIKVVYGSSLGIKDWYSAEGGDNWYLSAGTYTVTLADGAVTVVAAE